MSLNETNKIWIELKRLAKLITQPAYAYPFFVTASAQAGDYSLTITHNLGFTRANSISANIFFNEDSDGNLDLEQQVLIQHIFTSIADNAVCNSTKFHLSIPIPNKAYGNITYI